MKSALTVAGADPTGGAGLQADLKVFAALGVYGLSIPSVLTAQSTAGVGRIAPVEKDFFLVQMDLLLSDIKPDALKTGMLYSGWAVDAVAESIRKYSLGNLVVDPVTVSSTGVTLVEDGLLDKIRDRLFPLASVVTPNIYEASVLTGTNIEGEKDMEMAARKLKDMGPGVVVITGGHLERSTLDLYYDGEDFHRLEGPKIEGEYHGTGCAFSAAITALLAAGIGSLESVRRAKEIVTTAIRKAYHPGRGMGLLNIQEPEGN
jgi:hydroxymethylpyrimidine/phosphomethylpyrimidine kinase